MLIKGITIAFIILLCLVIVRIAIHFLFPESTPALIRKIQVARAGLKEKSIEVDGQHISYLAGGEGEPLLLLHGFWGSNNDWLWISRYLKPHFRIVIPDFPGFGKSSKALDTDYSVDKQVERLKTFTNAIGIESFHIGGISMGGTIAGEYAARYPETVKSLWLIAPGLVESALPSEYLKSLADGKNVLVPKSINDFDSLYQLYFVNPPYIPGFYKKHLAKTFIENIDLIEKIYWALAGYRAPLENALKGLSIPTLILWGDNDGICHVSGASVLEKALTNSKAIIMKDMGHLPIMEAPELTAEYYLKFRGIL